MVRYDPEVRYSYRGFDAPADLSVGDHVFVGSRSVGIVTTEIARVEVDLDPMNAYKNAWAAGRGRSTACLGATAVVMGRIAALAIGRDLATTAEPKFMLIKMGRSSHS